MNEITVLFFATFREIAGVRQAEMRLPEGASVLDFKRQLAHEFPGMEAAMATALVSVNREYAFDEELVPESAEIGIFPPVSGGADEPVTICLLTDKEVDLNGLVARISTERSGAVCAFTGLVRGVTTRGEGHETAYLEYEAYAPMAEDKMRQVSVEIRERWPTVEGIAIVQRVGKLAPQTPTVLIACAAAHRDTGVFEAARYGIDRLKEIVPVWKKEVGPGGEMWVEGKYIPRHDD
jgi:molybdopterin synthase catalytic subunit